MADISIPVNSQTKTLHTAGKYVPENIALTVKSGSLATVGAGSISGSVTDITGSNVTVGTTDTYSTGISVSASASASASAGTYSGGTAGWVSPASGTVSGAAISSTNLTSRTEYITGLTIPASKTFGSSSANGITINGTLYEGLGSAGVVYLKNNGGSSYTKIANAGSLITASLSHGSLSAVTNTTSPSNKGAAVTTDSNASKYVTASVSEAAGTFTSAGWLSSNPFNTSARTATVYIPSDDTSSFNPNAATFSTSATITPKTSTDVGTRPTSGNDRGFAINQDSTPSALYVKVAATSSGSGSAGSAKTLSVKDKYMLNNVSVSAPAPTKSSSSGDTNYILASNTSSATVTAGTLTTNAALENSQTNATLETTNNSGISITATSSGSATAGTGGTLSVQDKYMLNDITYSGTAIGSATTANSATKYLKEIVVPSGKTLNKVTVTGTLSTLTGGRNNNN